MDHSVIKTKVFFSSREYGSPRPLRGLAMTPEIVTEREIGAASGLAVTEVTAGSRVVQIASLKVACNHRATNDN